MTEIERLLIRQECERLVALYCVLYDKGDFDAFAELWAEDGVWGSSAAPLSGKAAIKANLATRSKANIIRHVSTNCVVDVVDADHAEGISYFTLYRGAPGEGGAPGKLVQPDGVGRYFDRFVRTADGWRFAERQVELNLRA